MVKEHLGHGSGWKSLAMSYPRELGARHVLRGSPEVLELCCLRQPEVSGNECKVRLSGILKLSGCLPGFVTTDRISHGAKARNFSS